MAGWGAFMASSARHQRELASKKSARGTPRPKVWQKRLPPSQQHRRDVAAQRNKLLEAFRQTRASAPPDVCPLCCHTGAFVSHADTAHRQDTNAGFAFHVQCHVCLRRVHDPAWGPPPSRDGAFEGCTGPGRPNCTSFCGGARCTGFTGWGQDDAFDDQDDAAICALLNAHGMPCTDTGAPSPLHFHRSLIHFHHRFGRTKRWSALAAHLRAHFTTTMSRPSTTLPPDYRGWYRIHPK